jgi:hypothetical protein
MENLFWGSLITSSKKGICQDLAIVYTLEKIDVIEKDNKTIVKRMIRSDERYETIIRGDGDCKCIT